jgi:biofilm PGA synthesis N-glycosyltransferase PgaC
MDVATFWTAAVFVAYVYVGYPLLILIAARVRGAPASPAPSGEFSWPAVTIVVAVRNERHNLARKLKTLRELDYDPSILSVIFVSDGSTDGTNEFLEDQPDVRLIAYSERRGKAHALNVARASASGEIVFFTDARQELNSGCLRALVRRFSDPGVGVVSGSLVHLRGTSEESGQIGLYWRYERWIRTMEAEFDSCIGATGACYAIRRRLWSAIPDDTLIDDFLIPMLATRSGYRVVFEPDALAIDEVEERIEGEFARKVRTLAGNFQEVGRNRWLLGSCNRLRWQLVSHKLLRLFVPYALLICFISSAVASGTLYQLFFILQAAMYAAAGIGCVSQSARSLKPIAFATTFFSLNLAAVFALIKYAQSSGTNLWRN